MIERPPAEDTAARSPAETARPAPATHHPAWGYGLLALVALAIVFGLWGVWTVVSGSAGVPVPKAAELERLEQEAATLKRSDQISRDANQELQAALALRDEEIAGLKADVAFYERFVGATAQPRGLTVHELELRPQQVDGQVWHFVATLTQTLDRDNPSAGRLTVSVEGTREGKLQRLSWADLRQQPEAPGREYSFRYFQRVEGDIVLPEGFVPLRVNARLVPSSGAAVERTFAWADIARSPAGG
ncbi:MAG: hypothetical protein NVV60_10965 [Luteimonas sp.]|nr:hypothetical protein [Luteimonas sp.]